MKKSSTLHATVTADISKGKGTWNTVIEERHTNDQFHFEHIYELNYKAEFDGAFSHVLITFLLPETVQVMLVNGEK